MFLHEGIVAPINTNTINEVVVLWGAVTCLAGAGCMGYINIWNIWIYGMNFDFLWNLIFCFYRNYMWNREIILRGVTAGGGVWGLRISGMSLNLIFFWMLKCFYCNYMWNRAGGYGRRISGMILDLIFVLLLIFFYRNYIWNRDIISKLWLARGRRVWGVWAANIWNDSGFNLFFITRIFLP